ncbi:hypothetical protein Ddye_016756 [Dipteronia dyeriana]|uniref:Dentin sialophosphoprotein-like n=1 Tax=Dipteronia dyeriana TaxID=168575 RepID=A0AAD9U7G7_9ROSI|nr:hypothetical protein Ddye_016756 [Dipteronia dyeriana]
MNVDWFQDNQWQTNNNKASDSKTIEMDVDLFDAWNDFSSSSAAQDSSKKQSGQAKQPEVTTTIKDNEMVENLNNSASISWNQDDQWSTSTNKTPDNKSIDDRSDLFDTWNDFTISTNAQDSLNKQTGQAKQFEVTANVKDDGIMGLSSAQDLSNKQSVNHMMPSVKQTAENNLQDFDFGGFSQPQVSPGLLKDQNCSTEVNIMTSEPSVSDRISDVNAKDNDVPTATTRSTTDNVETIISQMHDLSFMLESNLSIPQKQDEFHSFSKG